MEEFNNEESLENREPVRCPVKEIIVLVLGILTLTNALSSMFLACTSTGLVGAIVNILVVVGYTVAIFVLDSKIKQQATEISSKVKTGKTIAFISLGLSVIELVISILTFSSTYQPLFS